MDKQDLINAASEFIEHSAYNLISGDTAISPAVVGLKLYDAPLFAFGRADDTYFERLKRPEAIGEHFLLPAQWLPQAKTVVSFFLPYTQEVKKANREDMSWPAEHWLHGRYEGQICLAKLLAYLQEFLRNAGYQAVAPALDERFRADDTQNFTSNWSERHVAFVCGLGTFGLSRGLITKAGIAGRIGSIVTDLELPADTRAYSGLYEYCSMCGACVRNCPVHAISVENGKRRAPRF